MAILLLAAVLRIYGLRWGLPDALHSYSYHPDEFLTVGSAFGSIYANRTFDPGIYTYPSLYIYLSALAMAVGFGYGAPASLGNVYLIARIVTVAMGVGAVAATCWAGRVMFGWAVGLGAALLLAVAPLHVQHSHFATVDVPSTLFVALALGFAGLVARRGDWRDYVLAGAVSGLAAGTKYNAGLVVLSVVAAHSLRVSDARTPAGWGKLAAMAGCAAVAFVISTPGSVLRTERLLGGVLYEVRHAGAGHGLVFAGTGSGFVHTFVSSLWHGMGPALAVFFVLSVVWAIYRRDRQSLVVLAFVLPYYVLISVSQVRFARYALPLYPAAALLVGRMLLDWYSLVVASRARAARAGIAGAAVVLVLLTLACTVRLDALFASDPRGEAVRWIRTSISEASRVGVFAVPWYYSPPIMKNIGLGTLPQRQEAARNGPYELVVFSDCEEPGCWWTDGPAPEWVIVSAEETIDAQRLMGARGLTDAQRAEVDRILGDLKTVREHYRRVKVFGGTDPWWMALPHDMRYPASSIKVYRRAG